MTDIIKVVRQFTEAVGCTTDRYNVRQTALYIGLQLEEMAEKLEACAGGMVPDNYFGELIKNLHDHSKMFKEGEFDTDLEQSGDRAAMLDADIDLTWVTIGSALSQGADVEGAAGEVARANLSKLVNCHLCIGGAIPTMPDGEPELCKACNATGLVAIKDANGKVKKPEGWTSPNITPFVCKEA